MLNIENFQNARWDELYAFFAQGNPPLVLQLLLLNTVFLAFVVYRRVTSKFQVRKSSALMFQAFLILINLAFMFQKETLNAAMAMKHLI